MTSEEQVQIAVRKLFAQFPNHPHLIALEMAKYLAESNPWAAEFLINGALFVDDPLWTEPLDE
jgi:hypothetical protein